MNCGIIGCGRISPNHVTAIINNDEHFNLVATCDLIEEKAQERADQYSDAFSDRKVNIYTDYKEMLENEDLDIAIICTESGYHGEIALECLKYDVHLMIEKPMAMDLDEINQINKISREKNLKVAVSHQNRFNPPIQKLKKAIDEGKFGEIVNITGRVLWNRNQGYYDMAPWRGTKELDGGTLMNQGIHNLDILIWLMDSDVARLNSETDTFLRDIEMEDYGVLLMRFKNGKIGLMEGSADVYPKNLEETISVFGSTGTAVIGGLAMNKIEVWNFEDESEKISESDEEEVDSVYGEGHNPLYKDFAEAIKEDRDPLISGEEAKKSVEVLVNAYGWAKTLD